MNITDEQIRELYAGKDPLEALSMTISFSSRDWAIEKRDAWVYGIVCGWDDDCFAEFERKFGWDAKTFERLKGLHAEFLAMKKCNRELVPQIPRRAQKAEYLADVYRSELSQCINSVRRQHEQLGRVTAECNSLRARNTVLEMRLERLLDWHICLASQVCPESQENATHCPDPDDDNAEGICNACWRVALKQRLEQEVQL